MMQMIEDVDHAAVTVARVVSMGVAYPVSATVTVMAYEFAKNNAEPSPTNPLAMICPSPSMTAEAIARKLRMDRREMPENPIWAAARGDAVAQPRRHS